MKRPVGLLYAADEVPPPTILALSALQQMAVMAITLVYPIIIAREAGLAAAVQADIVSLSMFAMGAATILLCMRTRFVGSGHLCPPGFTAIFIGPSLYALQLGGMSLVFGMTLIAGLMQGAIAPLLRRLRPLLPPEIAGLVIAIIGLSLAMLGLRYAFGLADGGGLDVRYLAAAAMSLATMVVLNIWGRGFAKLFCVLIGIAVGYGASHAFGVLDLAALAPLGELAMVRIPGTDHLSWSFELAALVPFGVAALAATLRIMGDVSNAQRLDDAQWVRPEFRSLTGGVMANGAATALCGAVGALGINTHSTSVGLAGATGVTSRAVGFAAGGAFMLLAFVPMAGAGYVAMPPPVVGAVLFFVSAYVITSGLQMITARMLDARKTTVIGFSFAAAVMADAYRDVLAGAPAVLQPVLGNPLVLGTVVAVLLNLVMRIGVHQRASIVLAPDELHWEPVERFLVEQGSHWAARRDVVERAVFGAVQVLEVVGTTPGTVEIETRFDEFSLDVRVRYVGRVLEIPERRPSADEIVESEAGERRLAGYLLRRNADRVECRSVGERSEVLLHYEH